MAFFLKYRPQTFDDVVGQTSIIKTLQNALKNNRPAHAYLFSGSRGTGKTSTARIFAKGLNCQQLNEGNPCGACNLCVQTAEGSLVDVIEIDAASNRGIDEIRELREKIVFAPNYAQRKIYIIDEVHMLTKEAFNALLKTLEEPPEHAYFILATTEMHKLPETIVSRCQTFLFGRFTLDQLTDRLKNICTRESITAEDEALKLMSQKAEGGLRDAISLLEQMAAETDNQLTADNVRASLGISSSDRLQAVWNALESQNQAQALELLKDLTQKGIDFRTFGHDLLNFLRTQMHARLGQDNLDPVMSAIDAIEQALMRLKTSPIVELPFEMAFIKLCSISLPPGRDVPSKARDREGENAMKQEPAKQNKIAKPQPVAQIPEPTRQTQPIQPPSPEKDAGFVFEAQATTPTPTTPPAPSVPASGGDISPTGGEKRLGLDLLQEKMKAIAEKAAIPTFAKRSFLSTKPKMDGQKICFEVDSQFHYDQISNDKVRVPLQTTIRELYGKDLNIDFILNKNISRDADKAATADDLLAF